MSRWRFLALTMLMLVSACSSELRWYTNCGGCGAPPSPPDGGWGPGTCTTQTLGAECFDAGETCSTSADPCVPVRICTDHDPQLSAACQQKIP